MLHDVLVRAAHDRVFFLVLEQHAHDRALRNERVHVRADALIAGGEHDRVREARPVVVVDEADAVLDRLIAVGCGVDRQIAALGMPCDCQAVIRLELRDDLRRAGKVAHRLLLRRDGSGEAHVQVFLPADERAVRPAVGAAERLFVDAEADGGELGLALLVEHVHVVERQNAGIPLAATERGQQVERVFRQPDAALFVLPEECVADRRDRDRAAPALKRQAVERKIREPREDHAVDLVERGMREGDIPAPRQIIINVCHSALRPHAGNLRIPAIIPRFLRPGKMGNP